MGTLIVYAEASDWTYPGHMVVGQESELGVGSFFGFRFDPDDIPEEFRPPEQWRNYLLTHAVPGQIVDETGYVAHMLEDDERPYYEKRAPSDEVIEHRLPPRREWKPHAWYSFRPDDQYLDQQPCYNCVKWAIMIANSLVEGFLPVIPQGRLMLVLEHLTKQRA